MGLGLVLSPSPQSIPRGQLLDTAGFSGFGCREHSRQPRGVSHRDMNGAGIRRAGLTNLQPGICQGAKVTRGLTLETGPSDLPSPAPRRCPHCGLPDSFLPAHTSAGALSLCLTLAEYPLVPLTFKVLHVVSSEAEKAEEKHPSGRTVA